MIKKFLLINCVIMAIWALLAFSCEPIGKDHEPEEPVSAYYLKVAQSYDEWSGDYLITYTSGSTVTVLSSYGDTKGYGSDISSTLTPSGIHSDNADQYKAVVTKVGTGYSVNVTGIGYLGLESSANSLSMTTSEPSSSDTKYLWTFSYKDGGSLWMRNVANDGRRLQWNKSASCFRCYTGSQEELTLYRRTISTGGSTPSTPEPDPTPTPDPTPDPEPEPEPDPTPDPDPTPTPTPDPNDNCPNDWYELPRINYTKSGQYLIDSSDESLYYAHHLCKGGEKYSNGKTARNYTVCYSADHHCPVWVAAIRHNSLFPSKVERTNSYGKDPSIPSDIQYKNTDTGGGCNKGHMLGSKERTSSTATNKQVFYYTNIAPQYSSTFNTGGGGWNTLEDWVDKQVCSDTLYMVIGAYFDNFTDKRGYSEPPAKISFGGRSDVSRPTMFYYVLMRTKSGNTGKSLSNCSADEIMCAAFVRSHDTPKKVSVSEKDLMSVSDLEKITGFTYFQNVPQAPKSTYKASDWGL